MKDSVNDAQPSLEEDIVKYIAQQLILFRHAQDQKSAEFLATFGKLSMQELNVLNILGDHGTSTMTEIAKRAFLSMSSVTLLIDKLARAKLVYRERSERDRRVVTAVLTDEGQKIYQTQLEHRHAVIRQSLNVLTETEQATLLSLVEKVVKSLTA
jgi:DNA-binding MarR family transcriptional regulator